MNRVDVDFNGPWRPDGTLVGSSLHVSFGAYYVGPAGLTVGERVLCSDGEVECEGVVENIRRSTNDSSVLLYGIRLDRATFPAALRSVDDA